MKNLNEKSKNLKEKMKIYYGSAALVALMCASSFAQAMDEPVDAEPKTAASARLNDDGPVNQDNEKKFFKRALSQDTKAQRLLAQWYMDKGKTMEAFVLYKAAAKQGDAVSANALGDLLSDEEKKIKWHTIAAWDEKSQSGNANSQYFLGTYFQKKDLENAKKWFRRAATQGHSAAKDEIYAIAWNNYENGESNLTKNKPEAIRYFELAANDGVVEAQSKLGHLYLSENNLEKAVEWFEKAVVQTNATAEDQHTLGILCLTEVKVKNHKRARELFELAYAQGHLDATNRLAWMYYKGEGGTQDERKAIELWIEAAKNNNLHAREQLAEIVRRKYKGNIPLLNFEHPNAKLLDF